MTTLTHINRLETGKYNPSLDVVKKLASVLEVSLDDLVSENGNLAEVNFDDKAFYEKIKLLDSVPRS